jgi:hypothetical protein
VVDAEGRVVEGDCTEIAVSSGELALGQPEDPGSWILPTTDRASRWTGRHDPCLPARRFRSHNSAVLITVGGLPAHPLIVHAVVVLIPLTTLTAIVIAARGSWRRGGSVLVALGAVVSCAAAFVAMEAGEQLLAALSAGGHLSPNFDSHDTWGTYTWYATIPFALLAIITAVLARRGRRVPAHSGTTTTTTGTGVAVLAWVTALAGVVAVAFCYLAGDSGSRAVWGFLTGG